MHRTIEALYKDGRIIPLGEIIPVSEAKVLVTFLDEEKADGDPWKEKDLEVQDVSLRREAPGFYQGRCLCRQYAVSRQKIHDLNIAAIMIDHGISHLLTYNKKDFRRIKDISLCEL